MIGKSFGAISVINARPCGIGSTIGVCLQTRAQFVTDVDHTTVNVVNDPNMDDTLARLCVKRTLEHISEDTELELFNPLDGGIWVCIVSS